MRGGTRGDWGRSSNGGPTRCLMKSVYLTRHITQPIREALAASDKPRRTEPPWRWLHGECKVSVEGWQRAGLSG